MMIQDDYFAYFWTAVNTPSGVDSVKVNAVHNNVQVVKKSLTLLNNPVSWPGINVVLQVLMRPVYTEAIDEIIAGIRAHGKFYYSIEGSSGIGKTQIIGPLIEALVAASHGQNPLPALPTFKIHHGISQDNQASDVWLYYGDNNVPLVSFVNPLGSSLPTYFISDGLSIDHNQSTHLHLHITSLNSNISKFVQNHNAHSIKLFPPFSRSEHLWCLGTYQDIAAFNAAVLAEDTARVQAIYPLPVNPTPKQMGRHTSLVAVEAARGARRNAAAVAACNAAGGNGADGVWSDWEELQLIYDVFGGNIFLLRLPQDSASVREVAEVRLRLTHFFDKTLTSLGNAVTAENSATVERCAITLARELEILRLMHGRKSDSILNNQVRALFQHVVPVPGSALYREIPSSVFLSYYLGVHVEANATSLDSVLKGLFGGSGLGHLYEQRAHKYVQERMNKATGFAVERLGSGMKRATHPALKCRSTRRVFLRRWQDTAELAPGEYGIPIYDTFPLVDSVVRDAHGNWLCFQMSTSAGEHKSRSHPPKGELLNTLFPNGQPGGTTVTVVFVLDKAKYGKHKHRIQAGLDGWTQLKGLGE